MRFSRFKGVHQDFGPKLKSSDTTSKLHPAAPNDVFIVFRSKKLAYGRGVDEVATQFFSFMPHKTQTATDQSLYPTDQSLYQAFQPETVESHFFKW